MAAVFAGGGVALFALTFGYHVAKPVYTAYSAGGKKTLSSNDGGDDDDDDDE
jgi:hypothetical protein